MPNKAIFFDRDGVINSRIKGGYVRSWEEFDFHEEAGRLLQEVKRDGYLAIIITNQRGVGRGLMTEADLQTIHQNLQTLLSEQFGAMFDDIYYCTDAEDSSTRRKPAPTMLIEAAEKWEIDLSQSWMIGDSASDIEAGRRAGTKTAYLVTIHSEKTPDADLVLHNLSDFSAVL